MNPEERLDAAVESLKGLPRDHLASVLFFMLGWLRDGATNEEADAAEAAAGYAAWLGSLTADRVAS